MAKAFLQLHYMFQGCCLSVLDTPTSSHNSMPCSLPVLQLGAGNLSYLFTWQGSQPELDPVMFVSHTDVVPAAEGTLKVHSPHNPPTPPYSATHMASSCAAVTSCSSSSQAGCMHDCKERGNEASKAALASCVSPVHSIALLLCA